MANRVKTWTAEILTYADLNAEFSNIYAGAIDRTAGRWGNNDDIPITFGSSQDCSLTWNTTQTNDALVLGLGASRSFIICDEGDKGTDLGLAASNNPVVYIASNDLTAILYLYHDATLAWVKSSVGAVGICGTGGYSLIVDGTYNEDYQMKVVSATGHSAAIDFYQDATILGKVSAGASVMALISSSNKGVSISQDAIPSVYLGGPGSALATNATTGFVYIPVCNGAPSGTPATIAEWASFVPLVFDASAGRLYIYTGAAWHYLTVT